MRTMKIFHYSESDGAFLAEGLADADPLDAGNWLIPAHATAIEPPAPGAGQYPAWDGTAWELRAIET